MLGTGLLATAAVKITTFRTRPGKPSFILSFLTRAALCELPESKILGPIVAIDGDIFVAEVAEPVARLLVSGAQVNHYPQILILQ